MCDVLLKQLHTTEQVIKSLYFTFKNLQFPK